MNFERKLLCDLWEAFPDMQGYSPHNLNYMSTFAFVWPDRQILRRLLHKFPGSILVESLTDDLNEGSLPMVEEIEAELSLQENGQ